MNRKDWSENRRQGEVNKIGNKIETLEIKLDHLLSENWKEPYPNKEK